MSYGQQLSSIISSNNLFFKLKPKSAWQAIFALVVAIMVSLLAGGVIAIITFPLASLIVGWFLYRRYPLFYCSYVWWMWFVGSFVRRIIDLRCGYPTPGPWSLTSMLVTAISIVTLLKYLPKAHKMGGLPFIIAAACCLYGYLIGLSQGGTDIDKSLMLILFWLTPVAFGFHLFIHWSNYPSYRLTVQRTFFWGVLFMGFYGIVQYVFAPPWDSFYLKTMQADGSALSFGIPEPFGIRVFSTSSSPQEFAVIIGAGLILLFCIRGKQQLLANGFGYLTLLLSLARSGWLSWLVGASVFLNSVKFKLKIRILIGLIMTILIILPITRIEPFSTVIRERIETFSDADSDDSLRSRQEGFNALFGEALVQFSGGGLQNPIQPDVKVKIKSNYVIGDNGALVLLFTLGWLGTLPYILSIVVLVFQIRQTYQKNKDLFLQASYGIILGLLSQIFFKSITDGSMAIILWGFTGMGMSARNYYLSQEKLQKLRNN